MKVLKTEVMEDKAIQNTQNRAVSNSSLLFYLLALAGKAKDLSLLLSRMGNICSELFASPIRYHVLLQKASLSFHFTCPASGPLQAQESLETGCAPLLWRKNKKCIDPQFVVLPRILLKGG